MYRSSTKTGKCAYNLCISEEFFRQLIIYGFGNFSKIKFSDRIRVQDLVCDALKEGGSEFFRNGREDIFSDTKNIAEVGSQISPKSPHTITAFNLPVLHMNSRSTPPC